MHLSLHGSCSSFLLPSFPPPHSLPTLHRRRHHLLAFSIFAFLISTASLHGGGCDGDGNGGDEEEAQDGDEEDDDHDKP